VRGRLDARAFLVPPGTVSRVVELQGKVTSLSEEVASLGGRLGELQFERDELSAMLQDAEQRLVAAEEAIAELSALADRQLAQATATAERQVAEISSRAEQRVAEVSSVAAKESSLAEQRVAEVTALAEARLIQKRAIEARVDVVVAEREAALRSLDDVAGRAATEAAARVRADYESSRSWKMMAPFRKLSWFVPKMRGRAG
jgi:chromosome segregation ATPase